MEMLFTSHAQAVKVRIVLWVSVLVCAGTLYGGWSLFETYGLNPGDGGVLRPFGERMTLGIFVAALGLIFAGGMMVFASIYATHLAREDDQVIIDTLTPWCVGTWRHELNISEVGESAYHHGRFDRPVSTGMGMPLMQRVDAPWITIRTAGRRLPFIFDLQAKIINIGALSVLSEGAVEDWEADRG